MGGVIFEKLGMKYTYFIAFISGIIGGVEILQT